MTRVQQEALSGAIGYALARVMDGRALLIVPAPANEQIRGSSPPWAGRNIMQMRNSSIQTQLQTVATAYVQGDGFNLNRAANLFLRGLRALVHRFICGIAISPRIFL